MYGYVQVYRPDLRFREYDVYRSYYCGLCHTLQNRWGLSGRMTLSYDVTFLFLLLDALHEPDTMQQTKHCFGFLGKKETICTSSAAVYAADMNLLFAYLKCQDDWQDNHKLHKKLAAAVLRKKYKTICDTYPEQIHRMLDALERLRQYERQKNEQPHLPAGCFGQVLAEVFCYNADIWANALRCIGYHLGKFIYLTDAYDDLPKDRNQNNYNPFLRYSETDPAFHEMVETMLGDAAAEAAAAFERLPILRNAELLRNILYAGIWMPFQKRKNEYQTAALQRKQE